MDRQMLRNIQKVDPDGWPTEPTDEQRKGFREYVREFYGPEVERIYFDTDWDPVVTTWGTGDIPVPHPR